MKIGTMMTSQQAMRQVLEAVDHLSDDGLGTVRDYVEAVMVERGIVPALTAPTPGVVVTPGAPPPAGGIGSKMWIRQVDAVDWSAPKLTGNAVSGRFESAKSVERRAPGTVFLAKSWSATAGEAWFAMMRVGGFQSTDCGPVGRVEGAILLASVTSGGDYAILRKEETDALHFGLDTHGARFTGADLRTELLRKRDTRVERAIGAALAASPMSRAAAFAALALHGK